MECQSFLHSNLNNNQKVTNYEIHFLSFLLHVLILGLDEQGASERIMVTPKNFPRYNVNNISISMTQPISAEKLKDTIGIAPVHYDTQ